MGTSLRNVSLMLPLLVLGFLVAGLAEALVPRATVERLLGQQAGLKGILLGGAAGALMPGGPYIYYPVALSFFRSGAGIGTVVTFVVAKNLWSLARLPLEIGVLGPKLALVRPCCCWPFWPRGCSKPPWSRR